MRFYRNGLRFVVFAVLCALLLGVTAGVAAASDIKIVIDGEEMTSDRAPFIQNGRTLVPLRAIFEHFGATVGWDGGTQQVSISKEGISMSLTIGEISVVRNGERVNLDVAPILRDGRTMVPLRFIAETLGAVVHWNAEQWTVEIWTSSSNGAENNQVQRTGAYVGLADSRSFEVDFGDIFVVFALPDPYRWVFEELLVEGDELTIWYVEREGQQPEVLRMEKAQPGELKEQVQGTFNGLIDNHTVEIQVDSAEKAFTFEDDIEFSQFQTGDTVLLSYYVDVNFRNTIVFIEKVQ